MNKKTKTKVFFRNDLDFLGVKLMVAKKSIGVNQLPGQNLIYKIMGTIGGVGAGLVKFTSAGEGHTFQTFGKLNEKLCFSPGYTLGTLY